MKGFSYFFIILFVVGCNFKSDDVYNEDLGDGYFYVNSSGRGMIYKGVLKKTNTHRLKISGNVKKYLYDDNYITAFRHITRVELQDSSQNTLFAKQSNGDTLQYWIINKNNDSIFGPLNFDQYNSVSKKLRLNSQLSIEHHSDLKLY